MATAVAQSLAPDFPRRLSLELWVTIVGAVVLFLTIVYFNLALINHLDSKIDNVRSELKADIAGVRTELKADIAGVRTELKADIDSLRSDLDGVQTALEADIQRLDDRLFAVIVPQAAGHESDANPDNQ